MKSSGILQVNQLRVPVGMARSLLGFAVALQAVIETFEQIADQRMAHLMAMRLELVRQSAQTLKQRAAIDSTGTALLLTSTPA
jgi:hypothetical protein